MTLVLNKVQIAQIVYHSQAEAPDEACGLLAGVDGIVECVLPVANVAENPRVAYMMEPHDQLRHFQLIETQGLDLLGIYHSHPRSPAYPSPTDLSMAYYPEAAYVIVSLMQSEPVVRAFRLVDGNISEMEIVVVGTVSFDLEKIASCLDHVAGDG